VSAPHIDDELLDRYASGSLSGELLPALEEHLLSCPHCQTRLTQADEFVALFRQAATQPDARPQPLFRRLFNVRVLIWMGAAAAVAAVFALMSADLRKPPAISATVFMRTLRGPESAAAVTPGKPVRLVFDLTPAGAAGDYEIRIVDLLGKPVLAIPAEFSDGHLSVLIRKPKSGSYWVRVYRKASNELIAEYGLRAG
jgi:anti-sigma factor RsiW